MLPGTDKTFLIVFQILSVPAIRFYVTCIYSDSYLNFKTQKPVLASPPIIINHYQCQENESLTGKLTYVVKISILELHDIIYLPERTKSRQSL